MALVKTSKLPAAGKPPAAPQPPKRTEALQLVLAERSVQIAASVRAIERKAGRQAFAVAAFGV
jgi:hypothetical protein